MNHEAESLDASIYGLDLASCQSGTQADTLDYIRRWADNSSTQKQLLWLSGDKGIGKTTISVTMTREWADRNVLGGRFFFSQDARITSTTQAFCVSIARDMAAHIPSLQPAIDAAIGDGRIFSHCDLEQQFRKLVIEPLEQHGQSAIVVVDGLDRISSDIMRDQLLSCLLKNLPRAQKLKVLLSARPLVDIEDTLGKSDLVERYDIHQLAISDSTIHPDVSLYIERYLGEFREDEKTTVATLSQGQFLWLSTAVVMLKDSRQKEEIIQKMVNIDGLHHLDGLYHIALADAEHPMWPAGLLMNLLRILTGSFEPLSLISLCSLLRIPDKGRSTVEILLRVLRGLVVAGDANLPVRIRHADIRDFFMDPARSKEFYLDEPDSHCLLALASLDLLEPHLHYNIRRVEVSGTLPWNDEIPRSSEDSRSILNPTVAYASSYLPFHIGKALKETKVVTAATRFLREQFLCWAELMSWRGCTEEAIEALSYMETTLQSQNPLSGDLLVSLMIIMHLVILTIAAGA